MEESTGPDAAAATDAQLLKMAIDSGVDAAVQRSAIETFYTRYADGLYRHCAKVHWSKLGSTDAVRAFVGEVIVRFVRSGRFDSRVAKRPDQVPNLIRCWLQRQAQWLIHNEQPPAYRLASQIGIDLDKQLANDQEDPSPAPLNRRAEELREVLYQMAEKDQDILRTSFKYFDPVSETCRIPVSVQNAMCRKWGFARRNSLVKYRGRLVEKLKQAMSATAADAG